MFGDGALTKPTNVYVALYTATPSDSGGGTEVTGGAYARATVANDLAHFADATGADPATKTNAQVITYAQASANWGTVTHFGIFDAVTAGNLLYWGALTTSKAVNNGDTASFAAGALAITEQ
jgi:hypothetical protein